jgi:GNAT superfamily N-acetyltransferase
VTGAPYLVRAACEADLPHLTRLRLDWSAAHGLGRTDDFAERMRAWWGRQGGQRRAWLAFAGEEAVAMANVAVFERMPRPGVPDTRWAYVANVWVDPGHRRRGVARGLMNAVITWCRDAAMERIVLNPSAMSLPLYRGLGFRAADDLLRLDLTPER